jgi:hypothetical protein
MRGNFGTLGKERAFGKKFRLKERERERERERREADWNGARISLKGEFFYLQFIGFRIGVELLSL